MHEYVEELLSPYIDDELNSEERKAVEQHLKTCKQCREEVEDLRFLKTQMLSAYKTIEIPDIGFEQEVIRKIQILEAENRKAFSWKFCTALVIGILVIIFALLKLSPILYASLRVVYTLFAVGTRITHALLVIVSDVPYLLGAFIIVTLILIVISGWSVRRLFGTKTTG
ncbi:anti-sigma factor family protein [Scopulibacillus cellulosilyticus]|uniref:Anti-sigma-W factor RsiW n=1 Tax=Scopulibacillus cellulosilyticus TaxID=2665665 RepID=A0ABW2PRK4_9BACL